MARFSADAVAFRLRGAGGYIAGLCAGGDARQQPAAVALAGGGVQLAVSQYTAAGAAVLWYFAAGQILPSAAMQWLNSAHQVGPLEWPSFEFLAGFFGLTLYSTAFIAEEIRSGIRGVAGGQKYAAQALGLTGWQAMRYVMLPQALKIALPPLLGQYMNVIKNSSLTMAIGVAELSYASRQVETETLRTFRAFGVATVLYIAIIALLEGWGMWRQQRKPLGGH